MVDFELLSVVIYNKLDVILKYKKYTSTKTIFGKKITDTNVDEGVMLPYTSLHLKDFTIKSNKLKAFFCKSKKIIQIMFDNTTSTIKLTPILQKGIHRICYMKYFYHFTINIEHIRISETRYKVVLYIQPYSKAKEYVSLENLISEDESVSARSSFIDQQGSSYSKKYYPINAEQASYLETRFERVSRHSSNASKHATQTELL